MQLAFLGLGQMGAAIAQVLVGKGFEVTVWNRTAAAAGPLVDAGAKLAESPAQAVEAADVVLTMLLNDQALEDVLLAQGAADAMGKDAIHVSLSTISVELADRLEAEHRTRGRRFVSAPVFGRPGVAAEGKLWLTVAGPGDVIEEAKPVLEAISRGYTVVGERPSQANAVKVAGNFMISVVIAGLAEAYTVVEAQGVDAALFLETVNSALFQSAFVGNYGKMMISPAEKPGATVKLGAKDMGLFRAAAEPSSTPTPLAEIYKGTFERAIEAGRGDEDWAAGYLNQVRAVVHSR